MDRYFTSTGKWAPPTKHRGGTRSKKKIEELQVQSRENLKAFGYDPESKPGDMKEQKEEVKMAKSVSIKMPPRIGPLTASKVIKGAGITVDKLNDLDNKQSRADAIATQAIYDAVAKAGGPGSDELLRKIRLVQEGGVTPSEMGIVLQDLLGWIFGTATALKNEVVSVRMKAHGISANVKGMIEKIEPVLGIAETVDTANEKLTKAGIFSTGNLSEDLANGSIFTPNGYRIDLGNIVTLLAALRMSYQSEPLPADASLVDWLFSKGRPIPAVKPFILTGGKTWERMILEPRGKPVDTYLFGLDIDNAAGTVSVVDEATAEQIVPAGSTRIIFAQFSPEIGLNLRKALPLLGSVGLLSIGHTAASIASVFTPGLLGILGFSKIGAFSSVQE